MTKLFVVVAKAKHFSFFFHSDKLILFFFDVKTQHTYIVYPVVYKVTG